MRRAVCESAVLCAAMLPAARLKRVGMPRGSGGGHETAGSAVGTESGGHVLLENGGRMMRE